LVPATQAFLGATPGLISALLVLFGLMSALGNVLVARFVDRMGAANAMNAALMSMLAGHLLWPWSAGSMALFICLLAAFGLGSFSSVGAQQARLLDLSPSHAPVLLALNTSAFYLGQSLGTAAGGMVLAHVGAGLEGFSALVWVSVPLFVAAIAMSLFAQRRAGR
jgi:predicted MFS family arabinose efflux permease